jgi:endonuclease/exonuclease/phosphatase (EEP) superfamily protein YafD
MIQREHEISADLLIFGGDLNAKPGGDELAMITTGRFAQTFNFIDVNTTDPTRGGNGKFKHRVDYIFISAPPQVVSAAGQGETRLWVNGLTSPIHRSRFWPSDHVPVLHEYSIDQNRAVAARQSLRELSTVTQ